MPWLAVYACCALNAPANEDQLSGRIARADAHAAAAAAASGRWAGPASSRRPKILSSIDCGGDGAGEVDADSVVAALPAAAASAAARFSMDASESPGMSGRLEGRSQGWAAVPMLPLTLIGCAATSDAGGVGGCTAVEETQSVNTVSLPLLHMMTALSPLKHHFQLNHTSETLMMPNGYML